MKDKIQILLEELKCPSDEFTPIPFWFINDSINEKEIRRQLEDFKDKGVNGVVVHPRIGIPETLKYLSDEYMEVIRFIVDTAAELEMIIVLYDEGMYPSGSAHGEVVRSNPDLASIGITMTNKDLEGKVITEFDDGYKIIQRHCGGTIRGIHFGEDDGEPNAPPSADILNPNAVEKFISLTHDRYYNCLKDYFGNTIIGIFTDEPCVLGRNVRGYMEWTDGLDLDITKLGGSLKELRGLFENNENNTTRIYHKLIRHRLASVYYGKLSNWCSEHKISLMGHPKESDDIEEQKYFHIPGQDLVFRRVSPEKGGLDGVDSVQAKCSADAARHMGRRRNSNECFGVCGKDDNPWHITGGDIKWFIDWLGVRGVNMFIPHAFYYSFEGQRKDERPPDVGPRNIWWKYYRYFSDYMKRISYIRTDSKSTAKVIVPCESGNMPYAQLKLFYENQIEFHYIDKDMLDKGEIRDNRLIIGDCEYKYYFSDNDIELPIKRMNSISEISTDRDLITEAPDLRVAHIIKYGIDMYFLTNEGLDTINVKASIPVMGRPYLFDLWNGRIRDVKFSVEGERTVVNVELSAYESALLIFAEDCILQTEDEERITVNINAEKFEIVHHEPKLIQKIYRGTYNAITGKESIEVSASEMVECYCNGEFAGVSFWNTHKFDIGEFIKVGENEIELVVTGNIANLYSGKSVEYGLYIN